MAAQAVLCLAWLETPEDMFCRVVAQMFSAPETFHLVDGKLQQVRILVGILSDLPNYFAWLSQKSSTQLSLRNLELEF